MKWFFGGTVLVAALIVSFAVRHKHAVARAAEVTRVAQVKQAADQVARAAAEAATASAAEEARQAHAETEMANTVTAAARAKILAILKDPTSAQFRDVLTTPAGAVCGQVNAKNSMGGYNGFHPFLVYENITAIFSGERTQTFDQSRMDLDYVLAKPKSGC